MKVELEHMEGYVITKQAYDAAKYMRLYFTIEQFITGFM